MMKRIAVTGVAGRMGRTLVELLQNTPDLTLTAATEHQKHPWIGQKIATVMNIAVEDMIVHDSLQTLITDFDILIDFTTPLATIDNVHHCCTAGRPMVIGTTGFTTQQRHIIENAATQIAIVMAPNMSVGVNLCFGLLALAAQIIGDEADIEIIEAHHRHKVDAPSGTALQMGEVIAKTLGRNLEDVALYGRQGQIGPRQSKTIGFETIRAGDVIGDHTVWFATEGERIEITHKASSRTTFAYGALRAARWLADHQSGLFTMQDVLGLQKNG
jgi:4-hydroxy-tetrahydrodipicolinate reductase